MILIKRFLIIQPVTERITRREFFRLGAASILAGIADTVLPKSVEAASNNTSEQEINIPNTFGLVAGVGTAVTMIVRSGEVNSKRPDKEFRKVGRITIFSLGAALIGEQIGKNIEKVFVKKQ